MSARNVHNAGVRELFKDSQTDKDTISVRPFSQWDRPKQFSVLPRRDEMSAAERQRNPSHFLLSLTDVWFACDTLSVSTVWSFPPLLPFDAFVSFSSFRLHSTSLLTSFLTIDSLLCQTSPPQPSQPVSDPTGAATCQREITFILTWIRKLVLKRPHTNNFWSKNTVSYKNLAHNPKMGRGSFSKFGV